MPWSARPEVRRRLEVAFAPLAPLISGNEAEADAALFDTLHEVVIELCGQPDAELRDLYEWAERARSPGPKSPEDCGALARVYATMWLELVGWGNEASELFELYFLAVTYGAVDLFEDADEHELARDLALRLEVTVPMTDRSARTLFEWMGLDPDVDPAEFSYSGHDVGHHEFALRSHAKTMLVGARSAFALGDLDVAERLVSSQGWLLELPAPVRSAMGSAERLVLESQIALRRGDALLAVAKVRQALREAEGHPRRTTMVELWRAQLREEAGLSDLMEEEIRGLPGWSRFAAANQARFDARDRGSTTLENPWLSFRGVLEEHESIGGSPAKFPLEALLFDMRERGWDAVVERRDQLLEISKGSGHRSLVASILLVLLDGPDAPTRRLAAIESVVRRGHSECEDLGDLLIVDRWLNQLMAEEHSRTVWEEAWAHYLPWMDFVSDAVSTSPTPETPERVVRTWRMDVGVLLFDLDTLDVLSQAAPPSLRSRMYAALVRRFHGVLGRGLRHEQAWKQEAKTRPNSFVADLDTMNDFAARGCWEEFDAQREQMLLRSQPLRRVSLESLPPREAPTVPELTFMTLHRNSGPQLIIFDDFEGALRRSARQLDLDLPAATEALLVALPSGKGLRRELDLSSTPDITPLAPRLRAMSAQLGLDGALPRRFCVRASGHLQALPLATLLDPHDVPLGARSVPVIASGVGNPAELLQPLLDPTALSIGAPDFASGIPSLPGTAVEAKLVEELLPHASASLTGSAATRAALVQRLVHDPPMVLHVGTHAIADERASERSRLLLAGGDVLLFDEIAALDLRAIRLVVLSACSTMHGRSRHAEGILALSWAFKAAGAGVVVAARWPVLDAEAPAFWRAFYSALRDHGDVCEAMLAAVRQGIDAGLGAEVWGVYQLIA